MNMEQISMDSYTIESVFSTYDEQIENNLRKIDAIKQHKLSISELKNLYPDLVIELNDDGCYECGKRYHPIFALYSDAVTDDVEYDGFVVKNLTKRKAEIEEYRLRQIERAIEEKAKRKREWNTHITARHKRKGVKHKASCP